MDDKQQELIRDNLELKELCLYLDEERAHVAANTLCANCGSSTRPTLRDDGDGSSSSTNADETLNNLRQYERQIGNITKVSSNTIHYHFHCSIDFHVNDNFFSFLAYYLSFFRAEKVSRAY